MLVLSRQRDETIMIGDDIEITVVDIRGDKVRLGIAAPTRISVHRKEVYEAIKAENQNAARISGSDLPSLRDPANPSHPVSPAAQLRGPRPANMAPSTRIRPLPGVSDNGYPQGGAQTA